MTEYEPGTVATATVKGVANVRVTRGERPFSNHWYTNRPIAGSGTSFPDSVVTDVRKLVVIDPEDREQVERLTKLLVETLYAAGMHALASNGMHSDQTQAALREYANPTPPKPAEPTGLGAVVEDIDGHTWVSRGKGYVWPWLVANSEGIGGTSRSYSDIDAVKVLSEGVDVG